MIEKKLKQEKINGAISYFLNIKYDFVLIAGKKARVIN